MDNDITMCNVIIKEEPADESREYDHIQAFSNGREELDPMNLLEPSGERDIFDELPLETELITTCDIYYDYNDYENTNSSVASKYAPDAWDNIIEKYSWLVRDNDDNYGYCIYCDVKLFIQSLRKHERSHSHKDQEAIYKDFLRSQGKSNASIKKEIDSSNKDTPKYEHIYKSDLFMNFIWKRWLKKYKWLERSEGTMGYCKYCDVRLDVKFLHMRKRHENSQKHKEAGLKFGNEKLSDDDIEVKEENERFTMKNFMLLLDESDNLCYCIICDFKITKNNFNRHTKTKFHIRNENIIKINNAIVSKVLNNIAKETLSIIRKKSVFPDNLLTKYSWLNADPLQPLVGYCKNCKKSITHPFSKTKLNLHENLDTHIRSEDGGDCVNYQAKNENEQDQEHSLTNENEKNSDDSQYEHNNSESEEEIRSKRVARFSDDWFNMYKWCKKCDTNPAYAYCIYCKIPLLLSNLSRQKHERSARHKEGRILYKQKKHIGKKVTKALYSKSNLGTSSITATTYKVRRLKNMKAYILMVKKNHPWVTYNPQELKADYVFCKVCKDRVFIPNVKFVLKHENSENHKKNLIYKQKQTFKHLSTSAESTDVEDNFNKEDGGNESDFNDKVDEVKNIENKQGSPNQERNNNLQILKEKYPWVVDDVRKNKNYIFCEICKVRVLVCNIENHRTLTKHKEKDGKQNNEDGSRFKSRNNNIENLDSDYNDVEFLEDEDIYIKSEQENFKEDKQKTNKRLLNSETSKEGDYSSKDIPNPKRTKIEENEDDPYNKIYNMIQNITNGNKAGASSIPTPAPTPPPAASILSTTSRNSYDLFFESVSETVKNLPPDLAAEGKMKVMKIIYELEVRALERERKDELCATKSTDSIQTSPSINDSTELSQGKEQDFLNRSTGLPLSSSMGAETTRRIGPVSSLPITNNFKANDTVVQSPSVVTSTPISLASQQKIVTILGNSSIVASRSDQRLRVISKINSSETNQLNLNSESNPTQGNTIQLKGIQCYPRENSRIVHLNSNEAQRIVEARIPVKRTQQPTSPTHISATPVKAPVSTNVISQQSTEGGNINSADPVTSKTN